MVRSYHDVLLDDHKLRSREPEQERLRCREKLALVAQQVERIIHEEFS
jgi:hypothetical protein